MATPNPFASLPAQVRNSLTPQNTQPNPYTAAPSVWSTQGAFSGNAPASMPTGSSPAIAPSGAAFGGSTSTTGAPGTYAPQPAPGYTNTTGPGVTVNGQPPSPFPPPAAQSPLQTPGNNFTNPGYSEQGLELTQNRLLEDPFQSTFQNAASGSQQPGQGENFLNQNMGSLQGPGQGEQYWNQVSGQFQDPFAGEQFARQATQNMSPTGPAGAFFNQAQQQYGDFTGYSGPQASSGQYGANAASGPLSGQEFYNQVGGSYDTTGRYTDPNLAAGQYGQTQQAFGDLPIANFDPFYDRARQLGVQSYNHDAAGRGVYGSSEALSGVGNVITDIEAQRANRSFDAEMQRAQEQRMRQGLLGEQARMGDLSSQGAFGANLAGVETFGNLAKTAGEQTLGQQTMLGNQARDVDTSAQNAQDSNLRGVEAFGQLSNAADARETDRFTARTSAMDAADRTGIQRLQTGGDLSNMADDNARDDFVASNRAAVDSGNLADQRANTGLRAAESGSRSDLARLDSFNQTANTAEDSRQKRNEFTANMTRLVGKDLADRIGNAASEFDGKSQADWENYVTSTLAPLIQGSGLSAAEQQAEIDALINGGSNFLNYATR